MRRFSGLVSTISHASCNPLARLAQGKLAEVLSFAQQGPQWVMKGPSPDARQRRGCADSGPSALAARRGLRPIPDSALLAHRAGGLGTPFASRIFRLCGRLTTNAVTTPMKRSASGATLRPRTSVAAQSNPATCGYRGHGTAGWSRPRGRARCSRREPLGFRPTPRCAPQC